MVLEERKEHKELLNSNYENTNLNIFFVTKGDLNITDKTLFELRMLNKNMYDYKHTYLLKYKKLNDIMIENAGHKTNELELFSRLESFEDLKRYFKDNQYDIEEKSKKEKKKRQEEIRKEEMEESKKNPEKRKEYEEKWMEEDKKREEEKIEEEKNKLKPINIENTEYDILNTIPYNINFIIDYYFSKKRTIEIKGKEYIISKYKILYEKGFLHKRKNKFIKVSYDERNHKPVYTPVIYENIKQSDIPPEVKETTKSYELYAPPYGPYGHPYYKPEEEKKKIEIRKNPLNTINIVVELTILDKSKNPSYFDFVKLNCVDKKKNMENDFNLLAFSLFGIDLQKKHKDDYSRFFFNRNIKQPEKITRPLYRYPPYGYPPYGYGYPTLPPKKGGRKTIKKKDNVKRKKIIRKRKTIKNKNNKE
jgi:hypothetical protein